MYTINTRWRICLRAGYRVGHFYQKWYAPPTRRLHSGYTPENICYTTATRSKIRHSKSVRGRQKSLHARYAPGNFWAKFKRRKIFGSTVSLKGTVCTFSEPTPQRQVIFATTPDISDPITFSPSNNRCNRETNG